MGAEYQAFGSNPARSHERFHEVHDLIIRAWTQPGPFRFGGKHYNHDYVNIWPTPFQKPHPLIWIPSQGSTETVEWASHPDRRYTYLQTFSPVTLVKRFMDSYREAASRQGYEATADQLGWAVPVYVGDTDASAIRDAKPHYEAFRKYFLGMPMEMLVPPGYVSLNSMARAMAKKETSHIEMTIEMAIDLGLIICGSGATVRDRLREHQSTIGVGHLLTNLQFGTMPGEMTEANQHRFAAEVMDKLRAERRTEIYVAAE